MPPSLLSLYRLSEAFGQDWSAIDRLDPEATVAWDRDAPPDAKVERVLVAGGDSAAASRGVPWVITKRYGHMLYLDGRWIRWDVTVVPRLVSVVYGTRVKVWTDAGGDNPVLAFESPIRQIRLLLSKSTGRRAARDVVSGYSDPPGILGGSDGSPEVVDPGRLLDLIGWYV